MKRIIKLYKQLLVVIMGSILSTQSFATAPNIDGASNAERIVLDFYNKVFVQHNGDVDKASKQYIDENYIQHNPWVATGRTAFIEAFTEVVKHRPTTSRTVVKRVITSGDYVVLHVHSFDTSKKSPGRAGVDIFRVKNGKIIEHWDVWQNIPENMPHNNGMF